MANQSPDRRQFLEMLAKAAAASQFPGFSRWAFAGEHTHPTVAAAAQPRPADYKPQYFNGDDFHTIDVLTGIIIPKDETPGAREAGVCEFIDFMAAHGEEDLHTPIRSGLKWLSAKSQAAGGVEFVNLSPDQQIAILKNVAFKNGLGKDDVQGVAFFNVLRRYTVTGYYTSRMGLQELDFPGLKLYSQSPACPHTHDPEHLHLPAPRF